MKNFCPWIAWFPPINNDPKFPSKMPLCAVCAFEPLGGEPYLAEFSEKNAEISRGHHHVCTPNGVPVTWPASPARWGTSRGTTLSFRASFSYQALPAAHGRPWSLVPSTDIESIWDVSSWIISRVWLLWGAQYLTGGAVRELDKYGTNTTYSLPRTPPSM